MKKKSIKIAVFRGFSIGKIAPLVVQNHLENLNDGNKYLINKINCDNCNVLILQPKAFKAYLLKKDQEITVCDNCFLKELELRKLYLSNRGINKEMIKK